MRLNAIRKKEVRGQMLKILLIDKYKEMRDKIIFNTIKDMGFLMTFSEFSGCLSYLEGKGYVECRTLRPSEISSSLEMRVAKITPKGEDLLDRSLPEEDPGVTL